MSGDTNGHRTFLGRDAILALADRPSEALHVPEWNTWVRIGTWTLAMQWRIAEASLNPATRGTLLALVVRHSVVDEQGAPLFTDDDVPRLIESHNFRALQRISDAAMKWNGVTAETVDALGKASEPDPSGASPSASPARSG